MANLQVFMLILIEVGSYASLRFCAAHGSDSLLSNKHSEKTAEKTEGKDCLSSKNDLNVKSFLAVVPHIKNCFKNRTVIELQRPVMEIQTAIFFSALYCVQLNCYYCLLILRLTDKSGHSFVINRKN